MTKDRYAIYGLAIVAGGAVAIWAGVSPAFLLILLACPLMMLFMMRGMSSGQSSNSGDKGTQPPGPDAQQQPAPSQSRTLDGSHERIDQP